MKPKILTIVSRMNLGGIAVVVTETLNGTNDKYQHMLVTGRCAKNEIDYLDSHKIDSEVIYLNNLKRRVGFLSEIFVIVRLVKIIKNFNPEIIHTHASKAGFSGRLAALISFSNAKRIHTFHGHILFGYFPKFVSNLLIFIERILARFTHKLIAVSESSKRELLNLKIGTADKWIVIPLGVNEKLNNKIKSARDLRNGVNLVWIGRFEPIKNPLLAIESLKELRKLNPEISMNLRMVGDGNLLAECKKYATDSELKITFTGWTNTPFDYKDDLLLMTSSNEGFGLVVIEAGSKGIPTLSTQIPAVSEIIENGVSGFISPADPKAFAEKLLEVLSKPEFFEGVSQNIFNLVNKKYSLSRMLDSYYKLYNFILLQTH
jgi:glycosyltransferase involved in cell wall biosynthesis